MLSNKVSILIPSIRPDKLIRCVTAIHDQIDMPKDNYEVLVKTDSPGTRIGVTSVLFSLVEQSKYEFVMFLGDDTVPLNGFMKNAFETMRNFQDGWGLVGLNEGTDLCNRVATHWLASKKLLPYLDGEFFHRGYRHCFCDNELTERSASLGRFAWSKEAKIFHDHPILQGKSIKGTEYEIVYTPNNYYHDMRLFKRRKANGWKT